MSNEQPSTAFVLGGGGALGAAEVGMLRALIEAGVVPDLVVGTSIGAFNGALIASEPSLAGVERLSVLWTETLNKGLIAGTPAARLKSAMRSGGIATLDPRPVEQVLRMNLAAESFEDLPVRFQCVAASIERAREHWFDSGPIVPAVMASAALPGMFPPQEIDGEHFIDGGVVNSIPLDRARKLGATRAFVLQVGRIETALQPPQRPWEVAVVTFEIARRARFHAALARTEDEMEVHVLPTGGLAPKPLERANFDPLDISRVAERIEAAYQATAEYLRERGLA